MAWNLRSAPYDASSGKGGKTEEPSDNLYVTGLPEGCDEAFITTLFADYGTVRQCKVLAPRPGCSQHALVRFSSVEEATKIKNTVTGGTVDGCTEPLNLTYATKKEKGAGKGKDGGFGDMMMGKGMGGKGDSPWDMMMAMMSGMGDGGMGWGGMDGGMGGGMDGGMGGGMDGGCFGGKDGGKGFGKDGGKAGGKGGGKGTMDLIMQAFDQAAVLPGAGLGNDHNNMYVSNLPPDCTDEHLYKLFGPFGAIHSRGVKVMKNPDGTCKGFGFVNFIDASAMHAAQQMLDGAQLPDGAELVVKVQDKSEKSDKKGKGGKGGWA
eukprot:TRINITY_DN1498_c0_g1_i2.p1 TRINITY_DN1498_c0_g1~~TRINITY_DN1498_c0_g1_i2.p1  ORF type:complete len:320 (-),score=100.74 TRINITY_DN1498_c0_g1_i2:182-1141(-)